MSADVGRLAFGFGVFFTVFPAFLMLVNDPGSPQFIVSAFALIIGLIFATIAIVLIRISRRQDGADE